MKIPKKIRQQALGCVEYHVQRALMITLTLQADDLAGLQDQFPLDTAEPGQGAKYARFARHLASECFELLKDEPDDCW